MKHFSDFAALGGKPAFAEPLHVAQLNLPEWERVEAMFRGIFERQYFANHGPLVRELEQAIATLLGVKHVVCVTNGTVALMVMLKALELTGEVIVPAFTFPATVEALSWAGLTPVLCDVDSHTQMLTPELVRRKVTPRTGAILGVHVWGRACAPDGLQELAEEHGIKLVFDACHGIGCSSGGRRIGNFGSAEAFSFHATKVLNAAEGGCIATNDDELADRMKTVRSFHATHEHSAVSLRMNAKMSEAQAAMGLLGLENLERNIAANRNRYKAYCTGLSDIPGLAVIDYDKNDENNYQYIVVEVNESQSGLTRDQIFDLLKAENVFCRRHFYPGIHRVHPYRCDPKIRDARFPATDLLCQRLLQLPNGQAVSLDDIDSICGLMREMVAHSAEIMKKLALSP